MRRVAGNVRTFPDTIDTIADLEKAPTIYRSVWDRKPTLRAVYGDIYRHMLEMTVPGRTLEVGSGCGSFKSVLPNVVSTDILPAPWLDIVCDAQRLPFADSTFANIVMVDVLHHIESPLRFLKEAERVLRPQGRLVCCEPAVTPLSAMFYALFHDEPIDMKADPLAPSEISSDKDPYDGNQAIPTLLTGRYSRACRKAVPGLALECVEPFAFVAYPLSGGFRKRSMLSPGIVGPLLKAEWKLRHWLGRLAAFRMLAVYHRV